MTASLGAILAATIPLWVVLLGGLVGTPVSVASRVRLAAGFGGIAIVVLTAPDSALGGAPWAVAAFCVAPILWAAGSLLTVHADRPADRVVATVVQLLAGGTVLLLLALSLGELDPARWSDVSSTSAGAAAFAALGRRVRRSGPGGRCGRARAARAMSREPAEGGNTGGLPAFP